MSEDKDEYKRLIGKVGGHKSFLTRLGDGVEEFVSAAALDGPTLVKAEKLAADIQARLELIQSIFDDILGNPHIIDDDIKSFETYKKNMRDKLAELEFRISQAKAVVALARSDTRVGKFRRCSHC